MASGSQQDNVVDEWTTVQKPTRRRRPQRRRNRNHMHDTSSSSNHHGDHGHSHGHSHGHGHSHKSRDASVFFENAKAAQLHATVDAGASSTPEQIEAALETCLRELNESQYWETVRQILSLQAENYAHQRFGSIVCYGIGNFGTKRPSAPLWQLALAVLIRDHVSDITVSVSGDGENQSSDSPSSNPAKSVAMHYFEPLMTAEESKVLNNLDIRIIEENERGKRSVKNDNDSDDDNSMTLFFMPHCPMSLYTNLFHTNWDFLRQVIIFGNSLNNYIDGGNTNIVVDPQKQQALRILEVLQPFWKVDRLQINKKDVSDMSAYFEQAFNDSSFTSFPTQKENSTFTHGDGWPKQPQLDTPTEYDGQGEVL